MYIEHLNLKFIITIFLGIIPYTIARSQCDIAKKAFSYLKGSIYENIKNTKDCCNITSITCDISHKVIEEM